MDEQRWLSCSDPQALVDYLRSSGAASDRKARLFAVACCRRIWHLLTDERSRAGVDTRERYDDGVATRDEWFAAASAAGLARDDARAPFRLTPDVDEHAPECATAWAAGAASLAANGNYHASGKLAANASACAAGDDWHAGYGSERAAQASLLRCIFGNPFRPLVIDPSWLTLNVLALAGTAYSESDFSDALMRVLADALEDAGCTSDAVLSHLRGGGAHVKGCHVLDLLLGKE